jgi:hypothetical protein
MGAHATEEKKEEPELVYTPPAEVDGVPTGSTVHYDDEHAVAMDVKHPGKTTVTSDAKKYKPADSHTVAHERVSEHIEGDTKDTKTTKVSGSYNKADKSVTVGASRKNEHKEGEDVHSSEHGGNVKIAGANSEAGYKHTKVVGDEHKADETSKGIKINKDGVGGTFEKKHEDKRKVINEHGEEEEKVKSRATGGGVSIGPNGMKADLDHTRVSESGTSHKVSGGVELGKDKKAVEGGYTYGTKDGNSASVKVKLEDGIEVEEPKKVGDKWVVGWKHAKTVGGSGGGSYKGAGANVSGSHESYDAGEREFKSEAEAKEFKKHAAEKIKGMKDPRDLQGAFALEIGETRGHGTGNTGSVGGSLNFEGAKLGAGQTNTSSSDVKVRRVSLNMFEVTHGSAKGSDGNVSLGGFGVTASHDNIDKSHQAITARFDLSTKQGQQAFQSFCSSGILLPGGKIVATEHGKEHSSVDGLQIPILGASSWTGRTWENHLEDEQGHHDDYGGDKAEDHHPGKVMKWLGEEDAHSNASLLAHEENGKFTDYRMEANFSGDDGEFVRSRMAALVGSGNNKNAPHGKPSGKWHLSHNMDEKWMQQILHYYRDRREGFSESGPDRELHDALRKAKTKEDVMRVLTDHISSHWNFIGDTFRGAQDLGSAGFNWDVELEGDPNFPGEKGRLELEEKIKRYGEMMAASHGVGADKLVPQIDADLKALQARRAAVSNDKKYNDLPDHLRGQQLKDMDDKIHAFHNLLEQASVTAVKNDPTESNADRDKRMDPKNKDAYKGMTKEQADLAKLRDQIAAADSKVTFMIVENAHAIKALADAVGHYIDYSGDARAAAENDAALRHTVLTEQPNVVQDNDAYTALTEMRVGFLSNLHDPKKATASGHALLARLNALYDADEAENTLLISAAEDHVPYMRKEGFKVHPEFWAQFAD